MADFQVECNVADGSEMLASLAASGLTHIALRWIRNKAKAA